MPETIANWMKAMAYFIIGSILLLGLSPYIINGNYGFDGSGYAILILMVGLFIYTAWRLAIGETNER